MRYFWDTEDEKVYSENDLMGVFCDLMKDCPEYKTETFCDFLNNASGKNGSLVEIKKPLSADKVEEINSATLEFYNAMIRLYEAFGDVSEESFNDYLSDGYPFLNSLTDARYDVEAWCERVYRFSARLSRED